MVDPDLTGRTALVTGSAKGVGRELLLGLAGAGADVAVHYHSSGDEAADVADRARDDGVETTTVQADVTDPDDVDGLFDAVESDLGGVDLLVNNVGDFAPTHWEEIEYDTWQRVLETNFNGTCFCARRALPGMRDRGYGRIVNVGYADADRALANPKNFPYFVAKTGVSMFTRMLAGDTQDEGITVNCVAPYVVENSEAFPDDLPRGRPASFDDLRQAVLFFCEEASGYVSGETVSVDGGWLPEKL